MAESFVLGIDQGTTSSRAVLFDRSGAVRSSAQLPLSCTFAKPGFVEQDADDIWQTVHRCAIGALEQAGARPEQVAAIGIANQRETAIIWERESGRPIYPAVVWQSRQTEEICAAMRAAGMERMVREKTGLVIDAYFSSTKITWILDRVPGARERAVRGELLFGTVDSWLLWNLTGKAVHATDPSNASRTMLFNIHELSWDDDLLREQGIPSQILPQVRSSSEIYGHTAPELFDGARIPVAGMAGDQQAALFGQGCFARGSAKNTYGTGCFLLMNTGDKPVRSEAGLLTTVGWRIGDEVRYALEGSVFIAGAALAWLRDGLGILESAAASEVYAREVEDTAGVYMVPSFVGLGAPYWDPQARGLICGLTQGVARAHVIRAALESLAYQTRDVLDLMAEETGYPLVRLRVDGGASANSFLMQFQADILGSAVERLEMTEATVRGAAQLAGLAVGFFADREELAAHASAVRVFAPEFGEERRERLYAGWREAVARARTHP